LCDSHHGKEEGVDVAAVDRTIKPAADSRGSLAPGDA
jgi:hypothetical protein